MSLDIIRWWCFGVFAAAASGVIALNVFWTFVARREGQHAPSRVPIVAAVLGAVGAAVSPSHYGWLLIPCTILLDPGTTALLVSMVIRGKRGR